MNEVEILDNNDEKKISFNKDDSNNLINIYKDVEEYIDFLNKSIIIEEEDEINESK